MVEGPFIVSGIVMLCFALALAWISLEYGMVGRFICAVLSFSIMGAYALVANKLGYISVDFMTQYFYAALYFLAVMVCFTAMGFVAKLFR